MANPGLKNSTQVLFWGLLRRLKLPIMNEDWI